KDLVSKQIKTILVVRNPKDTAVSYYNHMTGLKIYKYSGEWKDWLPLYVHGKLEYGKYSTYLQEWERIIEGGSKFPLHVVYYEDL
ncbi:sulfotransferase domain-containing protein, partial [Staphylococcus aureus]|nr:sulfotransferase domain-containing protein [Staphylococcus aureus]